MKKYKVIEWCADADCVDNNEECTQEAETIFNTREEAEEYAGGIGSPFECRIEVINSPKII